jgi:putative membrane protein
MLASLALFVAFLLLYLYRISLEGPTAFPGPESVYRLVYLPTLAVHVSLAVVCVPLLYYVALLALTHDVAELPETPHPRVGRVAATLWLVSFSLGLVVYGTLYVVY